MTGQTTELASGTPGTPALISRPVFTTKTGFWLALFAALARPDLKVIALDRPFLLSLPNLSRQLYYVTDSPQERVSLVRRAYRHLRSGGSLLTFPAGHTEPDPDTYPGAVASRGQRPPIGRQPHALQRLVRPCTRSWNILLAGRTSIGSTFRKQGQVPQ